MILDPRRSVRRYSWLAARAGGLLVGLAVWGFLSTRETVSVPWQQEPYHVGTVSAAIAAVVAYAVTRRVITLLIGRTLARLTGMFNSLTRDE